MTSILANWNKLYSRKATCLLPHLILNSHIPLISWIHQEISSIPYQRLLIYLTKTLIVRNLSEELLSQKNSLAPYLKKWKLKTLKPKYFFFRITYFFLFLFLKEFDTLKDQLEKLMQNSYFNYKGQIHKLRKEIEKKDGIISKILAETHDTE